MHNFYGVALWLLCVGVLPLCQDALADAGDTFFDAQVLSAGVTSVEDALLFSSEALSLDLFLGAFDGPLESGGTLIDSNDDDSPIGDGFAPALFGVPVIPGGGIDFSITGFSDPSFIGEHSEEGQYQVDLTVLDAQGGFLDGFLYDGFLETTFIDSYSEFNPAWDGGTYDVVVNNTIPNDLDFFRFTGLTPGASFLAQTEWVQIEDEHLDTVLGWFDETGSLIASDDDSGINHFSQLSVIVPANGEVVLAVTGFSDFSFDGTHGETGGYVLILDNVSGAGNYDGDGNIDTDDYIVWRDTYGQTGVSLAADGNNNGTIDAADYTLWRDAYSVQNLSVAVPEPSGLLLGALLATMACLRGGALRGGLHRF